MSRAERILLLGGSGFVGRSVCEKLVERSGGAGQIVVPSRHPARAKHLQMLPNVQVAGADVHDDATLRRLVEGSDAVVQLIAILHGRPADFQRVHVDLPGRLGAMCARAGVRRLVHVSALGVSRDAPSHYLRSKLAGEEAVRMSVREAVLLRPSIVFGELDRFLNLFATLQAFAPFVPLAGAEARMQPVWVEDLAEAIIRCLDDAGSAGRTYECAGPRVYTLRQLVHLAGRWSGHERAVIGLPDPIARLQALAFEWLPGEPLITRDNIDSLSVPNVAGNALPGLDALGITPTALEAIAPSYLGRSDASRLDSWRARARRT
jgi:NADH dehydrogenase